MNNEEDEKTVEELVKETEEKEESLEERLKKLREQDPFIYD